MFVTASDDSHEKSLLQLLRSIRAYEKNSNVHVYDLGMTKKAVVDIKEEFSQISIFKTTKADFPIWMDMKDNVGHFAWKPILLDKSSTGFSGLLIWLDAGDKLLFQLVNFRGILKRWGFYSPFSAGTLDEWTHQKMLDYFQVPGKFLKRRNLNGAIVGFDLSNKKARKLLSEWSADAHDKDRIAPEGSNRSNHRQDQSLLTILAYKNRIVPKGRKALYDPSKLGILIHQDVEQFIN